jgi:uncharacterized membrane protein
VIAINPFTAVLVSLLALLVAYVWWSLRTKSSNKVKRTVDIIFLWPLILRQRRTSREKVFICVGVIIALLLICWPFTLPKP